MKKTLILLLPILLFSCETKQEIKLKNYNITWDSPSKDYNGSMPLGNGDIGLNVWVEENGDICFYIGKTDSWGDNGRLLKIGKVRIKCDPPLVYPGTKFNQELDLKTGTIRINSNTSANSDLPEFNIQVWVDANNPVIHISQETFLPVKMTAKIELWRTERYPLPELGTSELLEDRSKPGRLHEPVYVEPDIIIKDLKDRIGWYHYNSKSVGFDLINKIQGLSEYLTEDPILHRAFGAIITGTNAQKVDEITLSTELAKKNNMNVYVQTKHPTTPDDWLKEAQKLINKIEKISLSDRQEAHEKWWAEFWDRSWIHATQSDSAKTLESKNAFLVSRAYALQRFIDAAAGRGAYPIKFNGSIFTVPHPGKVEDADYRRWGPGYWWQNTRLPYLSMCTSGDYDLMSPFFKMYAEDIYKTNLFRTRKYFGFDGAYYPECTYFWGTVFTSTYGWTPFEEREDELQDSGYHKWEWVAGPELVFMMLDYYDHTWEKKFLTKKLLPLANDVIKYFDNYYQTNEAGELVMYPSQACETWWDCTNPMPELAGLLGICKRLLDLPENLTTEKNRKFWKIFLAKLPPLPMRDTPSGKALAPATRFENKRNVENPELYAVFPFRHIAVGNPKLELGINALAHRWDKGAFGWRQDDLFLTYMGKTKQAKDYLVERSKTYHENSRFPAFWGPNYDWVPDQDHGGILMKTFQSMLIQPDPYSKKIYLLPAWPKDWDCEFKVHAPYKTIIQGNVRDGQLLDLQVSPESRRQDIVNLFE
jgi:alpha-L-fucosidase 2